MARFDEAAQEEATAATPRCAQVPIPPSGQSRGANLSAGAPNSPNGQVDEREGEEGVNMEINADPPPPPDITESIVAQTQLLRRLTEATEQQINVDHHPDLQAESLPRKIETFIRLKPPPFNYSQDPMDADNWRRVIESKLDLTDCTDKECVALAVHQLKGTSRSWWYSFCNSRAIPASTTWEEFARAFRDHHVPRQLLI